MENFMTKLSLRRSGSNGYYRTVLDKFLDLANGVMALQREDQIRAFAMIELSDTFIMFADTLFALPHRHAFCWLPRPSAPLSLLDRQTKGNRKP
jgi:hypothetical protein